MLNRFESFDRVTTTAQIMKEDEQAVVELNRQQLLHGFKSDGDLVGEYRSPAYALMKERMNPLAGLGLVDLRLTGDFFRGFQLAIDSTEYAIFSTDWKTNKLMDKYSEDIFGLTRDSQFELWSKIVRDKFVEQLAQQTGCTIK